MREIEIRLAEPGASPPDLVRTLGSRIALLRERHGWRQRHLAQHLNLTSDRLSKIERGVREPLITEVAALSKEFGLTLDEMVFGTRPSVEVAIPNLAPADEELKALGTKLVEAIAGGWDLVLRTRRQGQGEPPR